MSSLTKTARLAVFFWLLWFVNMYFSLFYVRSRLIVLSDAVMTANNIISNVPLFRLGIVSNLLSQVFLFLFGLAVARLFAGVNKTWATVFLTSILLTVSVAVANTLNNVAALVVLSRPDYLSAFQQGQLNGIMMIFLRLNNYGQGIAEIFWWPYLFALGLLILKSGFAPKILGVLLVVGSFGYPLNTFTMLLMPQLLPGVIIQVTGIIISIGIIPTILWLLVKGVKEQPQAGEG